MNNIIEAIKAIYPDIDNVVYWETKKDGSSWDNPEEGLIWNNKKHKKPAWNDILSKAEEIEKEALYNNIIKELNTIAGEKIESLYPEYKQRNIDRNALLYPNDVDKQTVQRNMHDFIESIITKCRELKESLNNLSDSDLKTFDATDESNWS